MQAPYIPAKLADFALWLANFSTKLTAAPATYGLEAGDATAVDAVGDAFATAYALSSTPATRTSATIAATDAARAAAEATVRPYAVTISRNAGVTDANKVIIGVNLPNSSRTPVPPPLTAPVISLASAQLGAHNLGYKDATTPDSKAKPAGVIGMELFCAIGTAPAVSPATAEHVATVSKSPVQIPTDSGDAGKIATYFGRWVTRSGPGGLAQRGPFGAGLSVAII